MCVESKQKSLICVENLHQLIYRWNTKLKPTTTKELLFSRATPRSHVLILISHWLTVLFFFPLIGHHQHLDLGFEMRSIWWLRAELALAKISCAVLHFVVLIFSCSFGEGFSYTLFIADVSYHWWIFVQMMLDRLGILCVLRGYVATVHKPEIKLCLSDLNDTKVKSNLTN